MKRFQSNKTNTISIMNYLKGHNFLKNVGRVTDLGLCTSSNYALYLYEKFKRFTFYFMTISQRDSELLNGHKFHGEFFKGA